MVGENRPDVIFVTEHVIHKTLERPLGADLDKGAYALVVHSLQPTPYDAGGEVVVLHDVADGAKELGNGKRRERVLIHAAIVVFHRHRYGVRAQEVVAVRAGETSLPNGQR